LHSDAVNRARDRNVGLNKMKDKTKKLIIPGAAILGLALVGGIVFTWCTLPDSSQFPSDPGVLGRSIGLPLGFMFQFYPITIPVLLISGALIFASLKKEKLWWLSTIAFVLFGLYWFALAFIGGSVPLD
jgi:mannose/fructose/N-acetylgalactosamine-specific phosphotransferase system component IID